MDTKIAIILSISAYKIIALLVGLFFAYMGYKLFMAGIWGKTGDFSVEFGDNRLILKRGAPGIFFALFGALIVAITIWKGIEFGNISRQFSNSIIESKQDTYKLPENPPLKNKP